MKHVMDSFWRAVAYCIHPKVILLSLLPLILMAVIVMGLGAMYWELAVSQVRAWIDASSGYSCSRTACRSGEPCTVVAPVT